MRTHLSQGDALDCGDWIETIAHPLTLELAEKSGTDSQGLLKLSNCSHTPGRVSHCKKALCCACQRYYRVLQRRRLQNVQFAPGDRIVALTFTTPNVSILEIRSRLVAIGQRFLSDLCRPLNIRSSTRSIEVSQSADGNENVHLHAVLIAPLGYWDFASQLSGRLSRLQASGDFYRSYKVDPITSRTHFERTAHYLSKSGTQQIEQEWREYIERPQRFLALADQVKGQHRFSNRGMFARIEEIPPRENLIVFPSSPRTQLVHQRAA